jgi:hypothetical protein
MSEFTDLLTDYIRKIADNGIGDSLGFMTGQLRLALDRSVPSDAEQLGRIRKVLTASVKKALAPHRLGRAHPDVSAITIQHIQPYFRTELERRILANADLIKLNRSQAIDKTLQRFAGWASSVPIKGSEAIDRREVRSNIGKSVQQLDYERRRREIDQGHKMVAAIDAVIAMQSGAIAKRWHSNYRQAGYDYREDHKERDGKWYAIRGNWALKDGLMVVGPNGYSDEITAEAEEPYCQCSCVWTRNLRKLPPDMLTKKGEAYLANR